VLRLGIKRRVADRREPPSPPEGAGEGRHDKNLHQSRPRRASRDRVGGAAPPGEALAAERIATSQGIPLNFLEHILSELATAGVVRSQRRGDGGFRLAREPSQITVADIIRGVEGPLATVRGGKPEDTDYPGVAGQLPRVWIAVRKSLRDVVEHVTLADVSSARLPASINLLADDPEAWVTRSR
jgi:Rrf2 family protein